MAFELSARSRERLQGVHPDLVRVVERAASKASAEFVVLEGVRTEARQRELYAQGRTKPGKIVTDTMNTRHRTQRCGYGCAVDVAPVEPDGSIDWNDPKKFLALGKVMFAAAIEEGVPIRWGYDWDRDGKLQERGE